MRSQRIWFRHALIVVCLTTVGGPGSAFSQDESDADLRVDTQLVTLNVVARGGAGAIDDLSEEDFLVYDEGTLQEIAVFEGIAIAGDAEAAPLPAGVSSNMRDWAGAAPRGATVVLVDRLNTPTDDQIFMNERLLEFVESFDRVDRLALYELSAEGELRLVHNYTDDPARILARVDAMQPEHSLSLASSDNIAGFEASLDTVGVDRELEQFLTRGTADFREFSRQSGDLFLEVRVQRTLEALESVIYNLRGLPGRKNLVWLSGRFPFTVDPGNRNHHTAEIERSTVAWMEETGFLLTRSNVAVYPVDVRGPGADGDAEFNGVIQTIADMTGGRPFYGTNYVGEAIEEAVEDAEVVYVLGFYPSEPGEDGSFRRLRVEVLREGVGLRHRPGYFAFRGVSDAAPARGLAEFLIGPLDATEITLVGLARTASDGSGSYELLVLAEMRDLNLVKEDDAWVGEIDFVGFFQSAEDGSASLLPAETFPLRMTEEQYQQALVTGFLIQKPVDTEGQSGRLRFVVRDRRTGAAGSLWVSVGSQ
jgi:VWFA-related protein